MFFGAEPDMELHVSDDSGVVDMNKEADGLSLVLNDEILARTRASIKVGSSFIADVLPSKLTHIIKHGEDDCRLLRAQIINHATIALTGVVKLQLTLCTAEGMTILKASALDAHTQNSMPLRLHCPLL